MHDMNDPLKVERQRCQEMTEIHVEDHNVRVSTDLTAAEQAVLSIFRKYLMPPGKMLCLGSADVASNQQSIAS